MTQSAASPLPSAGVGRRLAAMVYDGMLLFAVIFGAALVAVLLLGETAEQAPGENEVVYDIVPAFEGPLFQLYLLAVIVLFFTLFWRKNGQTLGMQAWRLQLQQRDGSLPGWGQCVLRVLVAAPSLLLGGIGYWWIWLDPERRALPDRLSGTYMVVLPKRQP